MDNYKLVVHRENGAQDITGIVGNLAWQDNIDTLGTTLTFDRANSDDYYMSKYKGIVEVGDKIILTNNGVILFQGIIIEESTDGRFGKSYSAYDYMFYFNKSKLKPTQIKNQSVTQAIKYLCGKVGVSVYQIADIPTVIKAIYKDKTLTEILKDMLEQATQETGIRYKCEVYQGKLYIAKLSDLQITARYQLASNIASFDTTQAIGASVSKSRSMEDMSNSVIVTSSDEQDMTVHAVAQDTKNIGRYGLLQTNLSVEDKDLPKADNIAKNELAKLNKVTESTSIELLGDDRVKSGRILTVTEPITGLSGKYLVLDASHTVTDHKHKMKLNLERWE